MKNFKKAISLALSAVAAIGCVACDTAGSSASSSGEEDEVIEITIWAGGSSEYQWKKGSAEEEVYKYIEDLYYEESGTRLKFNVQFMAQNMKSSMSTKVNDGSIDAVISHVGGGDGLDDWFLGQTTTLYRDLKGDFVRYPNLGKWTSWSDGEDLTINALDRVRMLDGSYIGIPSVITPYKFGILVRKDWMEACGYTDDPADTTRTLVNDYVDFENMAVAMKEEYDLNYAVSGAIYEVEKTGLLGAYGLDAGYYTMTTREVDGAQITDYGGLINPAYADVLEVESRWIQKGVLATSPDAIKVNECEEKFIAEATGIFMQNGTIEHLIEVARACKAQNSEAEFAVLCGLTKDENSTAKGNMRNAVGTFMASITANTPDYAELLQFLNWVYKSEDNYNLCRYGKEGVHWIDNGDGTYSYPEGYSYHKKPYSGILTLVENQVISNLQYKEFTDAEKSWIAKVRNPENYIVNDTVDYLLYVTDDNLMKTHFANRKEMSTFTQNVWDKKVVFTETSTARTDYEAIVNKYCTNAKSYSMAVNELYNALKG